MINSITITGHLGDAPEFRKVGSKDTDLAVFSVAHSQYNGPDSDPSTIWLRCNMWGGLSKWAGSLEKGDRVTVNGHLKLDEWETEDGEERSTFVIDVRSIHTPKKDSTGGERTKARSSSSRSSGKKKSSGRSTKKKDGLPF